VNRFLGLVIHVVNHSARSKSIEISADDREDLCAEVFLTILKNDFAVLRAFRGASSLATYLTVIARRVVIRELVKRQAARHAMEGLPKPAHQASPNQNVDDRDEVGAMMNRLDQREADVIRMYHMEGQSYREISDKVGIPENSVGPTLSRARGKLREAKE
jgi:RNA polymerase sigma-70 factor (ECF subfamily)